MSWKDAIDGHYVANWNVEPEVCSFSAGPINELSRDFCVLRFPPHGQRKNWTYATRCMSEVDDASAIELHLFSGICSDEVVELLVAVAHYHRTAEKLKLGHSVNFGKPWISRSGCEHGLISLPYIDGPRFELLPYGSRTISFYWLIPISESELRFKMANGLEALEELFERSNFDYADPQRSSVI